MFRGGMPSPATGLPASPAIPASPFCGDPRNAPNARNKDRYQAFGFIQSIYYWPGLWAQNLTANFRGLPIRKPPLPRGLLFGVLGEDQPARPLRYSLLDDALDESSAWPFLLSHIAF